MGFRIIVYNNIITKFYTFQAEREREFYLKVALS